jgi:hypothetical protein
MDGTNSHETQKQYFQVTGSIPEEVWYWSALGSIIASAGLWVTGARHWSQFVGQWPPTFLLMALFHKQLHPGQR